MIVYHGSNITIETPKILEPNRALDFGKGFYTTLNEKQSVGFARKVKERLLAEKAIVNVYEVNIEKLKMEMSGIWFEEANEAWLDYVSRNRNGRQKETYDFAYGPVANDDVFRTFAAYQAGLLTKEETLSRLKIKQLYNQLTFKSEQTLAYIRFITSYEV